MSSFFDSVLFVAGFVVSIYSWPKIKVWGGEIHPG